MSFKRIHVKNSLRIVQCTTNLQPCHGDLDASLTLLFGVFAVTRQLQVGRNCWASSSQRTEALIHRRLRKQQFGDTLDLLGPDTLCEWNCILAVVFWILHLLACNFFYPPVLSLARQLALVSTTTTSWFEVVDSVLSNINWITRTSNHAPGRINTKRITGSCPHRSSCIQHNYLCFSHVWYGLCQFHKLIIVQNTACSLYKSIMYLMFTCPKRRDIPWRTNTSMATSGTMMLCEAHNLGMTWRVGYTSRPDCFFL